jgi:tetratricopeptide (TPR) repeat protein
MAKAFTQTILDSNLLGLNRPLPPPQPLPDDETFRQLRAVTPLDLTIAEYQLTMLTSGWPFVPHRRNKTLADFHPTTKMEEIALNTLKQKLNYWEAHVTMNAYYLEKDQVPAAIAEARALVEAFPKNWKSHRLLANTYIQLQQYDAALPLLQRVINEREDAYSYKWIGTILLNRQRREEAIPNLEKALALNPTDYQARYNLSGAYYLTGNTDRALAELERLLEEAPQYPNARNFYEQLQHLRSGERTSPAPED